MRETKRHRPSLGEWDIAQQEDRAEWAARLAKLKPGGAALRREKARKLLEWLVDKFLYRDLASTGAGELQRLRLSLGLLIHDVTGGRWLSPTERQAPVGVHPPTREARILNSRLMIQVPGRDLADVHRAQDQVRKAIEAIVRGSFWSREAKDVGGLERINVQLRPSDDTPQAEWPQVPRGRHMLTVKFAAPLTTCLLMATIELLADVPPQLLRWCPWRVTGRAVEDPNLPLQRALSRLGSPPMQPRRSEQCGRAFVATKRQKWCPAHQDAAARERDRRAQQAHRQRVAAARKRKTKSSRRES